VKKKMTSSADVVAQSVGGGDLTRNDVAALQLSCKLIAMIRNGDGLPVAQRLLVQQLLKVLRWFRATRDSGGRTNYDLLRQSHPLLVAAIESMPDQVLLTDDCSSLTHVSRRLISQHIDQLREILKQTGNVMIIACAHLQNGCPNAGNCMFCFN